VSYSLPFAEPLLVSRAQRGDERAFTLLYRKYVGYVACILRRLVGAGVDAELDDMLQETFADAYLGLSRLRDPDGFRPWIRRIAARCAYDRLLSRRRSRSLSRSFDTVNPKASDPNDRAPVDSLNEVLSGLSSELRTPWILHAVHGETFDAVAARCRVSLSTAKRRITEAQSLIDRRSSSPCP
jgi:RNA polymerase sigma-70 factor (ECF subfamily)